jgi:uncharacterized membrane protein
MRIVKTVLRYLYAVLFIVAGAYHFLNEPFYMQIMPDYIPLELHRPAVIVSGVAEIVLGLMLAIPRTTVWGAWGMVALLIAVFPANIFVFQHPEIFPNVSPALHLLRLPLQGVMIAWAWWYTLPQRPTDNPAADAEQ